MTDATDPQRFTDLGRPRRVWAVAAIHGDAGRLAALHGAIRDAIRPGDRVVYLGNMLGRGPHVRATLDEILSFRREVIAAPGFFASDVVFLRGMQEEMWQKCLQLHFAVNPGEVLRWMLDQPNKLDSDTLRRGSIVTDARNLISLDIADAQMSYRRLVVENVPSAFLLN